MAKGKWQVDPTFTHDFEVEDRQGNKGSVSIRELSETDVRAKNAKMIKFAKGRGRNSGDTKISLEEVRAYEMEQSIVRWDFEDSNGNILEINAFTIGRLPQAIADQIYQQITEFNGLPEDRYEEEEDEETGEVRESVVEHPTTPASVVNLPTT